MARLAEKGKRIEGLRLPSESEADAQKRLAGVLQMTPEGRASMRSSRVSWPEDGALTNAWLRKNVGGIQVLSEDQLWEVSAAVLPVQFEYEQVVDRYLDSLEGAIGQVVGSGSFKMYPYIRPEDPVADVNQWQARGGAFYSNGVALQSGWCGSFSLFRDDYPDVAQDLRAIGSYRSKRDAAIRAAAEGLGM